jgi:hypothetical protein
MLRILVDTCVWLDLVKDYRNQPVISALEILLAHGDFALIVPEARLECPLWRKVKMSLWARLQPFRNATLGMSTCTEASPRPDRLAGLQGKGGGG